MTKTKTIATQGGVHGEVDQSEHIQRSLDTQKNGGDYQTGWRGFFVIIIQQSFGTEKNG